VTRRSVYRPDFPEQARQLCLVGATDKDLAELFGVTDRVIRNWKTEHPEFGDALRKGKLVADMQVAQSLHNKALAGDTVACIFWLKNRQRDHWRDKIDHEVAGKDGGPIVIRATSIDEAL
jgi:hypothetical protein